MGPAVAPVHRHARAGGDAAHPPLASRDARRAPDALGRAPRLPARGLDVDGGHRQRARAPQPHARPPDRGALGCRPRHHVVHHAAAGAAVHGDEHPDGVRRVADAFDVARPNATIAIVAADDGRRDRRRSSRRSGCRRGCATSARAATTSPRSPTRPSPRVRRPATCRGAAPTRWWSCSKRCGDAACARAELALRDLAARRSGEVAVDDHQQLGPVLLADAARREVRGEVGERERDTEPARSTTKQHTRSPNTGSGAATAAHNATDGWLPTSLLDERGRDVLSAPDDEVGRAAAHASARPRDRRAGRSVTMSPVSIQPSAREQRSVRLRDRPSSRGRSRGRGTRRSPARRSR